MPGFRSRSAGCAASLVTLLALIASSTGQAGQGPAALGTSRQALVTARDDARMLLQTGQAPSVPEATYRGRDAALTLESLRDQWPASSAGSIAAAVRGVVLAAWQVDAAAEAGDLAQLEHAAGRFANAVTTIEAAIPAPSGAAAAAARPPVDRRVPDYAQVHPVLRERCAACHDALDAPPRLLDYASAVRAAGAIRAQVMREVMPPWFLDPEGPAMAGSPTILAGELDTLLRWAGHGTPEGPPLSPGPTGRAPSTWPGGPPNLVVHLPPMTLEPGAAHRRTIRVPAGVTSDVWVRTADVLPSEYAWLRSVEVRVEGGEVILAWLPGEPSPGAPAGTAFRVPAGATLVADLRFRALPPGGAPRTTTAAIGLYTTEAPLSGVGFTAHTFDDTLTLTHAARVRALRVMPSEPLESVSLVATAPDGRATTLLRLRTSHPGWPRRYWLTEPITLPAGTSLSVHVSGENPAVEVLTDARATP